MGTLTLPASGRIYADADCIIYSVEKVEPYSSLLQPLWAAAQTGTNEIITSELTLLETLVKPIRDNDTLLQTLFRQLLVASKEVRLLPISRQIIERAAELRAQTTLKTPDAIHVATALEAGCSLLITNDGGFRQAQGLSVGILSDIATP